MPDDTSRSRREERRHIFSGRIVDLRVERVALPNGTVAELEIVGHPGGAAVVALDDGPRVEDCRVCLVRQYRHVARGWLWELPAGKIDAPEPPIETARRELAEEAGLAARRWHRLGEFLTSPGIFTERIHLYLARDLSPVPPAPEPEEVLEVHWLGFAEALERVRDGAIVDAKTALGLLLAAPRLMSD